jgi:hypothetical protein
VVNYLLATESKQGALVDLLGDFLARQDSCYSPLGLGALVSEHISMIIGESSGKLKMPQVGVLL